MALVFLVVPLAIVDLSIITTSLFPTGAILDVTRKIYCKEENAAGLTPPNGWIFVFVDSDGNEIIPEPIEQ